MHCCWEYIHTMDVQLGVMVQLVPFLLDAQGMNEPGVFKWPPAWIPLAALHMCCSCLKGSGWAAVHMPRCLQVCTARCVPPDACAAAAGGVPGAVVGPGGCLQ